MLLSMRRGLRFSAMSVPEADSISATIPAGVANFALDTRFSAGNWRRLSATPDWLHRLEARENSARVMFGMGRIVLRSHEWAAALRRRYRVCCRVRASFIPSINSMCKLPASFPLGTRRRYLLALRGEPHSGARPANFNFSRWAGRFAWALICRMSLWAIIMDTRPSDSGAISIICRSWWEEKFIGAVGTKRERRSIIRIRSWCEAAPIWASSPIPLLVHLRFSAASARQGKRG